MEKQKQDAPALGTDSKQKPRALRGMLPYLGAAFLASAAMALYFFSFVPSKLEYFVGLRFRTLAVAGGQVKSKVENLYRSYDNARKAVVEDKDEKELEKYLRLLVPEIQGGAGGGFLTLLEPDKQPAVSAGWEDIASQAAAASAGDFDDLVLANEKGEVLWQRERTSPRVINLNELLTAESELDGFLPSLSWGLHTTAPKVEDKLPPMRQTTVAKSVNLSGRASYLLVQLIAIDLPVRQHLYVAGVVTREALQRQAMHIPTAWVVVLALPVVLLFLSLPFVKLATLTPKERYRFLDVALLAVATILAAGIGAMLVFVPSTVNSEDDRILSTFADEIENRLAQEAKSFLDLADDIRADPNKKLNSCVVQFKVEALRKMSPDRCSLWKLPSTNTRGPSNDVRKLIEKWSRAGLPELDVAIWVDENGEQISKWTTKSQVTAPASHRSFDHFRDVQAGRLWSLKSTEHGQAQNEESKRRFTIDPLRTPTTSELGFAFAVPPDQKSPNMFVLNVQPQSLVDVVVPPGYGFAVLAESGKVLLHSEDGLSLEENFFEEIGDRDDTRDRAQSGRHSTWSEDYHGRSHRLHMRPMTKRFAGCPWSIVTFQQIEPRLSSEVRQEAGIFRLGFLNLVGLGLVIVVFCLYWKFQNREVRDTLMSLFLVSSGMTNALKYSVISLSTLGVMTVSVLSYTYFTTAHQHLDAIYLFFLILPPLALGAMGIARKAGDKGGTLIGKSDSGQLNTWMAAELALLVLLIGAAPAAGFSRIVYRFERLRQTERGLQLAQERWSERQLRARERAQRLHYDDDTQILLAKSGFAASYVTLAGQGTERTQPLYSYLGILDVTTQSSSADSYVDPFRGQELVRRVLEWSIPASKDVLPDRNALVADATGKLRLNPPSDTAIPPLSASYVEPAGDHLSWINLLSGVLILGGAVSGAVWSNKTLAAFTILYPPKLEDLVGILSRGKGYEGILLIGPARTNKDTCVLDAVMSQTGGAPERIQLLDAKLAETMSSTLEDIETTAPTGKQAKHIWIHVSNLEAQLVNAQCRSQVIQLFEKLLQLRDKPPFPILVVTSTIDPITQFKEIFAEERHEIYRDSVPEVELSRASLVLSRFRRCYVPLGTTPPETTRQCWQSWINYDPLLWSKTAEYELIPYVPLAHMVGEIKASADVSKPVPLEVLARTIQNKAQAYYELLWTTCSRSEKLVLIQLAHEGFVNPKSKDVVMQLINKGLITEHPSPMIFNYTFRAFLRSIERSHPIADWERMEGSGLWVVAGRLVASSMIAGGAFYLITQGFSVQSLLPILSGTGVVGVPFVRDLLARLSGNSGRGATASA